MNDCMGPEHIGSRPGPSHRTIRYPSHSTLDSRPLGVTGSSQFGPGLLVACLATVNPLILWLVCTRIPGHFRLESFIGVEPQPPDRSVRSVLVNPRIVKSETYYFELSP